MVSSKIYIMDIRNYTWVNTFEAIQNEALPKNPDNSSTKPPTPTPTENPPPENNKNKVVIGVLSGIIGVVFLCIIGFLVHKWLKKRKQDDLIGIHVPGA